MAFRLDVAGKDQNVTPIAERNVPKRGLPNKARRLFYRKSVHQHNLPRAEVSQKKFAQLQLEEEISLPSLMANGAFKKAAIRLRWVTNMTEVTADAALKRFLAERIHDGDTGAEEEMVQVYWRAVFRIAMVRLRDRDAAQDIAQDTLMTVLKEVRAGKLREPEKIAGFIHGVENNFIKSFQRKRFRSVECELDPYLDKMEASQGLIADEQRRLAQEAIHSLGATDQIILLSLFVDGRSLTEIAGRLGMSPESVRARKSRAIKRLKKKFNRMSHP